MNKQKKVIDIFPPKKFKEFHQFPVEENIKTGEELKETKTRRAEKKKGGRFKKSLLFIFLFLIGAVACLHFIFASVNIEIWPETKNVNLNEQVSVEVTSQQLDLALAVIPGKIFETERSVSQDFNATGETVKENNAQGTIRVYNNYSSPQTLVQNTRFQPALDKVIYFRSVKSVTVPAKGYLDIEVRADRPGEEYNIEPATFSVPGLAGLPQYYSVYAKSFSKMNGGFKGSASQVKDEDLAQAQKILSEKIKNDVKDYFAGQSDKDFIFLDEAISQETLQASSSVSAGKEAESFNFSLKVKAKALAFKKSDLDNFVRQLVMSKIQGTDKKIEEQSLKVDYSAEKIDLQSGKIILNLKISAKAYSDINEESVKKALFGKSIKESQTLLENQPAIVKSKFRVFPPWLKKVPENGAKIQVKLNID